MNLDEQIDKLKNTLENIFKEKDNIEIQQLIARRSIANGTNVEQWNRS